MHDLTCSAEIDRLQEKIAKNRLWPVEVMRMPMPAGGKGKKVGSCIIHCL